MRGYTRVHWGKAATEPGGGGKAEGCADGARRDYRQAGAWRCHPRATCLSCLFTAAWVVVALAQASRTLAAGVQSSEPNLPVAAEEATKTRTQLLNELSLRTAQVDLEHAKEAYDRYEAEHKEAQVLFQKGIMSRKELDQAISAYAQAAQALKQAEILLEKTKLGFLDNATHITILEAKKYYDNEGRRMLDLVLKNTSNLRQAESALIPADPNLQVGLTRQNHNQIQALLNIENIIVAIVNNGSSIGKPYEQIVSVLPYGQKETLHFELLADAEEAGVRLEYLGQRITENIHLEKESLQKIPTVVPAQTSQEGQLGTSISYQLDLEMLVTSDSSFSLLLTNLPPQLLYSFVDSGGARITSLRFTELVSKFNLMLQISIPEKLDVGMIDKTINFQAWVVTTEQAEMLNELKKEFANQEIPVERFAEIDAGRVDLALIPKGTGRLEIVINNLFKEIKLEQDADIEPDLNNYGTLTLFHIIPELTLPLDWTATISPDTIEKLAPNEKTRVRIHLTPGPDVGVGQYEIVIKAKGQSGGEQVEALERRFNLRVNARTNITATLILVVGLVVLITGIVFVGVRLSRR